MIELTRTTRQTGADQVLLNELNASGWRFQLGISCQSQLTGQGLEKQFNVKMCEYIIGARKKQEKRTKSSGHTECFRIPTSLEMKEFG